jgi:hypothetical protein
MKSRRLRQVLLRSCPDCLHLLTAIVAQVGDRSLLRFDGNHLCKTPGQHG